MREIKFRAWDIQRKLIFGVKCLVSYKYQHPQTDKEDFLCAYDNRGCGGNINTNVILMQFTGLKDKNGKEIYEGDRIAYKSELENSVTGNIYWSDIRLQWVFALDEKYQDLRPFELYKLTKNIEIVGNIYESPEEYEDDRPSAIDMALS